MTTTYEMTVNEITSGMTKILHTYETLMEAKQLSTWLLPD